MPDSNLFEIFSDFHGYPQELIPILQKIQEKHGFLSEDNLKETAHFLKLSENHVYGVASFYAQFRFNPPGKHSIHVCVGTACHVRGGASISQAVTRDLGITPGETSADGRFDYEQVACMGCCALAPVVQVDGEIFSGVSSHGIKGLLDQYE
jgi:NADH-quinone oxidoreductase subunit E